MVGNPFSNVPASDRATSTYYWFNPAAFAEPAQGTYSNEGRNEFYGPPTHQIDFSVFKNFGITEHITAQFRAEIFNIFNFVNYSEPANEANGSNLGQVIFQGLPHWFWLRGGGLGEEGVLGTDQQAVLGGMA